MFEHDSTTSLPGGVSEPSHGGRKMIRLTRVLLAGLLNHAKVDSSNQSIIHKQIFHLRSKLIQRKQNQTDISDQDSAITLQIDDEDELSDESSAARNEQQQQATPPLHPFFQNRTRQSSSEQNGPTKKARKITDDTQIYLPLMKKALYLLLCINSTSERLPTLERSSSGSSSDLYSTLIASSASDSSASSDLARQLLHDRLAGSRRGSLNSGLRM